MDKKSFLQAGHTPTLLAAFLYFDLSFMVWVILGPLGIGIAKDLGLSHAEKGLMVATPVLAGALLRVVMGVLVDRLSPKKAAIIGQVIVIAALMSWVRPDPYNPVVRFLRAVTDPLKADSSVYTLARFAVEDRKPGPIRIG